MYLRCLQKRGPLFWSYGTSEIPGSSLGGEEVKVWMGPVRARGQDYILIESYLFFFELLAPAFLVEVDLKVGCDPRDSGVPFLQGLFAGDLSCLERLSLGGLL